MDKVFDKGFRKIVFCCEQLYHLSGTGIGIIVDVFTRAQKLGGKIVLVNVHKKVLDVFQVLGFDKLLPFASSIHDAVEELNKVVVMFPKSVDCPICRKKLKVIKEGKFRCYSCKTILFVDKNAKIYLN
jgi:hypothetical protein